MFFQALCLAHALENKDFFLSIVSARSISKLPCHFLQEAFLGFSETAILLQACNIQPLLRCQICVTYCFMCDRPPRTRL